MDLQCTNPSQGIELTNDILTKNRQKQSYRKCNSYADGAKYTFSSGAIRH